LNQPGRTLKPLNPVASAELEGLLPAGALLDPERPVRLDELVEKFVPPEVANPMATRVAAFTASLLVPAGVFAAWPWTPLRNWVELDALVRAVTSIADFPAAAVGALAAYVVGSFLVLPISILIVATAAIFDPVLAGAYAFAGTLANAAMTYWIARHLGRDTVQRLAGARLNPVTFRLARKGVLAIAVMRLLPIASFPVANAVAGASRFRVRDFLLGTAIGMAPVIALIVAFVDRVKSVVLDPGPATYSAAAQIAIVLLAAALFVWHRFGRADVGPTNSRSAEP
jgi:uncharacterized membrane protein YdjX (TVP38/TMEM64 family)